MTVYIRLEAVQAETPVDDVLFTQCAAVAFKLGIPVAISVDGIDMMIHGNDDPKDVLRSWEALSRIIGPMCGLPK